MHQQETTLRQLEGLANQEAQTARARCGRLVGQIAAEKQRLFGELRDVVAATGAPPPATSFVLNDLPPPPPSVAPQTGLSGDLSGEWVGDYHEHGKKRVRIDYVTSESGTTIRATKVFGDQQVTWEVPMGETKGRANCQANGNSWWCDGDLIIRGPNHIAFRWSIWKTVEYNRRP